MWHQGTDAQARRDTFVAFIATVITYATIGILLTMFHASGAVDFASIPVVTGALLPVVYVSRRRQGSITTMERLAFREAGSTRQAMVQEEDEPDIVSIAPARRTGPITFDITELQVPNVKPVIQEKCELHKGIIHAGSTSCKRCGATYCKACASQLASLGEPCWACHHLLEW